MCFQFPTSIISTHVFSIPNIDNITYDDLSLPINLLLEGQVVAIPTETVYGLAANAFDNDAISKIYVAKNRPSDNPLIVHIDSIEMIDCLANSSDDGRITALAEAFWPGPLTVLLPVAKHTKLAPLVTANLDTVGIRIPNHPITLALIKHCGFPLAAPSANLSGKPSPTSAIHVLNDMNGRIAGIIDGGASDVGVESTIVDLSHPGCVSILRPGGITLEQIRDVLNCDIAIYIANDIDFPLAPGMKYTHYSPSAPFTLIQSSIQFFVNYISHIKAESKDKIGILCFADDFNQLSHLVDFIQVLGPRSNLKMIAHNLFDCLRAFDDAGVSVIYGQMLTDDHLGLTIMNRLLKASGYKIIYESR